MFLKYVRNNIKSLKDNFHYLHRHRQFSNVVKRNQQWNILFFGSDEFSLASLKSLNNVYRCGLLISNLEVVTKSLQKTNPVYRYAKENHLAVHKWPIEDNLIKTKYNIGIVVSFGNLIPEKIINAFPLGMLNVHASLLPRWRGAAPIIHALAAGDTETGVTIMQIKPEKFDIGDIIRQKTVQITPDTMLPDLTRQLSQLGAETLIETLNDVPHCLEKSVPQPTNGVTYAPRIQIEFSRIHWQTMSSVQIYNLYRALKGLYPLQCLWMEKSIKIFKLALSSGESSTRKGNLMNTPGYTIYSKQNQCLETLCIDGRWITITELSVNGKRVIKSRDFYNGYMSKCHIEKHVFT